MKHNTKSPSGEKPESFDSRIKQLDWSLCELLDALLVEAPNQRRAKLLALHAALGYSDEDVSEHGE